MQDKDKIIEGLLKSKTELIANRNERFAIIKDEINTLTKNIDNEIEGFISRVRAIRDV